MALPVNTAKIGNPASSMTNTARLNHPTAGRRRTRKRGSSFSVVLGDRQTKNPAIPAKAIAPNIVSGPGTSSTTVSTPTAIVARRASGVSDFAIPSTA